MHASLTVAKQHRYSELGDHFYTSIFEPPVTGGNPNKICSVCGDENPNVIGWDKEDGPEEQSWICPLCKSFAEDIGKPLPKTNMLALGFGQPIDTQKGTAIDALLAFGMQVQFLSHNEHKINMPGAQRIIIWHLDDIHAEPSLDAMVYPLLIYYDMQ